MAKNTVLWTPIHPVPIIHLYTATSDDPIWLLQKHEYFHSERILLEKMQHENEFFMTVYLVWSKPDNWTLKQCHKFTVMSHSSSESLAEWYLQSDYMVMHQ